MSSTLSAFRITSRTTVYTWNALYLAGNRKALENSSSKPHSIRYRHNLWSGGIYDLILSIRKKYPGLTKEKVYLRVIKYYLKTHRIELGSIPKSVSLVVSVLLEKAQLSHQLLDAFTYERLPRIRLPSVSTVGRIITELQSKPFNRNGLADTSTKHTLYGRTGSVLPRARRNSIHSTVLRTPDTKTKDEQFACGERIQIDSVEVRNQGVKWYFIGATDVRSKVAVYIPTLHQDSASATQLLNLLFELPFLITPNTEFQTDNGSEFKASFSKALEERKNTHYYNYPRSPKMNTFIEKTNDSFRKEFIPKILPYMRRGNHCKELVTRELAEYLYNYNFHREHQGIDYFTPMDYIQYITALPTEVSKRGWTGSSSRHVFDCNLSFVF